LNAKPESVRSNLVEAKVSALTRLALPVTGDAKASSPNTVSGQSKPESAEAIVASAKGGVDMTQGSEARPAPDASRAARAAEAMADVA